MKTPDEPKEDEDLLKNLAPDDIKKISNFADFISKKENEESSKDIYKIMGI